MVESGDEKPAPLSIAMTRGRGPVFVQAGKGPRVRASGEGAPWWGEEGLSKECPECWQTQARADPLQIGPRSRTTAWTGIRLLDDPRRAVAVRDRPHPIRRSVENRRGARRAIRAKLQPGTCRRDLNVRGRWRRHKVRARVVLNAGAVRDRNEVRTRIVGQRDTQSADRQYGSQ